MPAEVQAREFFANGGTTLYVVRVGDTGPLLNALVGQATDLNGLNALTPLSDLRVLLVPDLSLIPADSFSAAFAAVRTWCEPRQIFFILDPPSGLATASAMISWINAAVPNTAAFCAVYYPYLQVSLDGVSLTTTASGSMAAIYAKNDANAAVWKSPSGTSYPLQATGLTPTLTANDLTTLNNANVNAIRQFSGTGIVPFAARTLDRNTEDARYIPVVRTLDWVQATLQRSLAFAATQDDAAPLWSDVQTLAGNFLQSLYQQGAFQGATPAQAYYVRCDATTTSSTDVAAHRVNLFYGVALSVASEFDVTELTAATADATRLPSVPSLRPQTFGGQLLLSYPTEAGFDYHLQSETSLGKLNWSDASVATGDGAWRTASFSTTNGSTFYRVQITASP